MRCIMAIFLKPRDGWRLQEDAPRRQKYVNNLIISCEPEFLPLISHISSRRAPDASRARLFLGRGVERLRRQGRGSSALTRPEGGAGSLPADEYAATDSATSLR